MKNIWLKFKHLREDHELELDLLHSIIDSVSTHVILLNLFLALTPHILILFLIGSTS